MASSNETDDQSVTRSTTTRMVVLLAALLFLGSLVALGVRDRSHDQDTVVSSEPNVSRSVTSLEVASIPMQSYSDFALIFDERFDQDAKEGEFLNVYTNWFAYPGWNDTSKRGTYQVNNLSVKDGKLTIRVRSQNGRPTGAAPQPKINQVDTYNQLYGRYEVRFRADRVPGYHMAWLLWPKSEKWPQDGEIDFPEGELTGAFSGFVHWQGGKDFNSQTGFRGIVNDEQWHTAVIEWRPNNVKFFLDDQVVGESSFKVPNTPMRWVLQTETSQSSHTPKSAQGVLEVDYARVWKYTGENR